MDNVSGTPQQISLLQIGTVGGKNFSPHPQGVLLTKKQERDRIIIAFEKKAQEP